MHIVSESSVLVLLQSSSKNLLNINVFHYFVYVLFIVSRRLVNSIQFEMIYLIYLNNEIKFSHYNKCKNDH